MSEPTSAYGNGHALFLFSPWLREWYAHGKKIQAMRVVAEELGLKTVSFGRCAKLPTNVEIRKYIKVKPLSRCFLRYL